MKDYYAILGVQKSATHKQIKIAYRQLILAQHPDKGGANDNAAIIIEAYNTLIDDQKRREYDEAWQAYNLFADEIPFISSGYLTGTGVSYSETFKQQYSSLFSQYNKEPLSVKENKRLKTDWLNENLIPDLISFIAHKKNEKNKDYTPTWKTLTPAIAVQLLLDFLQKKYVGNELNGLLKVLQEHILLHKAAPQLTQQFYLYEGVYNCIVLLSSSHEINDGITLALQKIVNYSKSQINIADNNFNSYMKEFAILFSSKIFRHLFKFGVHHYLLSDKNELDTIYLKKFDGGYLVNKLIENLKQRLSNDSNKNITIKIIKYINLLSKLENIMKQYPGEEVGNKAKFYRDKGYLILDWIPALSGLVSQQILINTLLQAAISFIQSSRTVNNIEAMTDESLAINILMVAISIAKKSTPNVELYANIHVLRFLTQLKYEIKDLDKIIIQLSKRTDEIGHIFPIYQDYQSNIALFEEESQTIGLLRNLLHYLINLQETKQQDDEVDSEYINVLYHAYEACLKNWYEMSIKPDLENSFRSKLMQALLKINRWTFTNVDELLNPKSTIATISRDASGWVSLSRQLNFSCNPSTDYLNTIEGIEINYLNGNVKLIAKPWKEGSSCYSKLLTNFDFEQIIRNKATSAIFSLDPPDPNLTYHPFNKIRFQPSSLYNSQLLHTMLLADYLLKFLTVGYEVQAAYPYSVRALDDLIKPLPSHLKKIITDFNNTEHSGEIHRFWIEAEELPAVVYDQELKSSGVIVFAFNDMCMIVKKHKMRRSINGHLEDEEDTLEGWNMYVITTEQKKLIDQGSLKITEPSIIWIETTKSFYFCEETKLSGPFKITNYDHFICRLFNLKRNESGKIVIENSHASQLIYNLTKKITQLTHKSNRFSPEYIFAQEFSIHYNEFAMYFPELGRLRELSKVALISRMLENERLKNDKMLNNLKNKLYDTSSYQSLRNKFEAKTKDTLSQWSQYRKDTAINNISVAAAEMVKSWGTEIINTHFDKCVEHLRNMFKEQLSVFSHDDITLYIKEYLNKTSDQLIYALAASVTFPIIKQIQKIYPGHADNIIYDALNEIPSAITIISEPLYLEEIENLKKPLLVEIQKCERLEQTFSEMGLQKNPTEIDLDKICLWVPASVHHRFGQQISRVVYGGVQILGNIKFIQNNSQCNIPRVGDTVWRVYGSNEHNNRNIRGLNPDARGAQAYGQCWTPVNPASVANYRRAAGLPNDNPGRFVAQGIITNSTGIGHYRPAAALHGNPGGIPEVRIPNPQKQVKIVGVYGVNPEL